MVSKALSKYVQSLHHKKYRQRHGAFLVEGGKSVLELLSSDLEAEHCWPRPTLLPKTVPGCRDTCPSRLPPKPS